MRNRLPPWKFSGSTDHRQGLEKEIRIAEIPGLERHKKGAPGKIEGFDYRHSGGDLFPDKEGCNFQPIDGGAGCFAAGKDQATHTASDQPLGYGCKGLLDQMVDLLSRVPFLDLLDHLGWSAAGNEDWAIG